LNKSHALIVSFYQTSGFIVLLKIVQEVYQKNAIIEKTDSLLILQKTMDVYLPRIVYGMCLVGTVISVLQCLLSRKKAITTGWNILLLWSTVLAIVQRPFASMIVLISPLLIYLLTKGSPSSLLIRMTILHFLGHHLFFATGHQATFTSLPWKAAFVGFDEMNYYGGMILVTISTIAGYIISWIGWFILLTDALKYDGDIRQPLHLLNLLQSIPTFLCAIFILILRRHLMTWKIFAPRFLVQVLLEIGSHLAAIILEKAL
jgi:phosphatidylinositol glycan class O